MRDPFKGFSFPSEEQINAETKGLKVSLAKLTLTENQANHIWDRVWGPDRGYSLFEKLAEEYGCASDAVQTIAHGNHYYSSISKQDYKQKLADWHSKYGYHAKEYHLRSPGNDLLDYYDEMNSKRGTGDVSKIPPSVVFHARFRIQDYKDQLDYMWDWVNKNNVSMNYRGDCKRYLTDSFKWLVDEPHTLTVYNNLKDLTDKVAELKSVKRPKTGNQIGHEFAKCKIAWYSRGKSKCAGWSVLTVDKN